MGVLRMFQQALFGKAEEVTSKSTEIMPLQWEGNSVRVVMQRGEPWFIAADVCRVLGIANASDAVAGLDDDEQALATVEGLSRGNDQANIINESGLYSLIFKSRKEEARRFRKWVTSEVLPSIRKHGYYLGKDRARKFEKTHKMDRPTAETRVNNVDVNKQIAAIAICTDEKSVSTIHDTFHLSQWGKTARELRKALGMYKTKGKHKGELSNDTPLNKMHMVAISQDTHLKSIMIQKAAEARAAGVELSADQIRHEILKTGKAITQQTLHQLGIGHEWKIVDDPARGPILAAIHQLPAGVP